MPVHGTVGGPRRSRFATTVVSVGRLGLANVQVVRRRTPLAGGGPGKRLGRDGGRVAVVEHVVGDFDGGGRGQLAPGRCHSDRLLERDGRSEFLEALADVDRI
jgi:hypothetical protein